MPQRRILFLDASCLTVYSLNGRKVQHEMQFNADPMGFESFEAYLTRNQKHIFMMLVDVPDEGFQNENIPFCSGKDRAAIIKRKLNQYFYGTPYSVAHSNGRQQEGRRDEHLLMMALTRPQHLEPWLSVMRQAHSILAGIYALPQLLSALLEKDAPGQLLLINQTRGGLRQTFFVNRQLRFSRLTPLATGAADEFAVAAVIEAGKMHQYLSSQRLVERNKPLVTRVLVHPAQISAMRERCRTTGDLHFDLLDLLTESRRVGGPDLTDSQAELLFCHLLSRNPPREQFAPPTELRYHQLWQTQFALKGVSAVILATGVLFAAKQGLEISQTQQSVSLIEMQVADEQRKYDSVMQALPKIPLTTDNLRALVDRYDAVTKKAQGPAPLLQRLSQSLEAFPGISIDSIEWSVADTLSAAGTLLAGQPAPVPDIGPFELVVLSAQLPLTLTGNQRAQLAAVNDFAKHLAATPHSQVTILQPPIDTQSGKTLKSGDEKRALEAPRFSLRFARKL